MTGRELIIYILQCGLEDQDVFKDGRFLDFMTQEEAAVKYNVGVATIHTALDIGIIQGIKIGETVFVKNHDKD